MRKIVLACGLSLLSTIALAGGSFLKITSTTATDITKYNGDSSALSYNLTLSAPADMPLPGGLFLKSIAPVGNEPALTLASTTCGFDLKTPVLPGQSCTVTYTAPVPALTDKTKSQIYNEKFQVLDGLGKSADSSDFKLTVLPDESAGELTFFQNDTKVTSLDLGYNSTGTIVLKNTGNGTVSDLAVSIPQDISSEFSSACGASLAPNATCNITYTLEDPLQGNYTLSASGTNASATSNLSVAIANRSTLVFQKGGSTVTTEPTSAGQTENLTVKNTGDDPAQGFSLSVPQSLNGLVSGSCLSTTTLAANASCAVQITSLNSQADAADSLTASANNAASSASLAVTIQSLSQLVFQSGAPAATITQANVSEKGTLDLTVKNTGSQAVTDFSVVDGGVSDAIQPSSTCPQSPTTGTMSAGGTCRIVLDFDGAGVATGNYQMSISGTGALPSTLGLTVSEEGHFTVKNDSNDIINNLSVPASVTSQANVPVNLTVENTGGSTITNMNIVNATSGTLTGSCTTETTLAAGATCSLVYTTGSSVGTSEINFHGMGVDNDSYSLPLWTYNAWAATQGPVGAEMSAIIKDGSTLYAGVYDNGGVYKSTDGAQNWIHTGKQGIKREVESMKQIGTRIYAITLNSNVFVYNTADSTPVWTAIPTNGYAGRSLAVNGTTLYAGFGDTSGQVYQLTDGSTTWSQVGTDLPAAAFALAVKDNVLYAGTTGSGVYKYESGSWTQFGLAASNVKAIANVNGELYAAVGDQLYHYNTGTDNWDTYGGAVGGGPIFDINIWMGNIIVGCEHGVYEYSSGAWSKVGTTSIWGYHLLPDGSTLYAASISSVYHGIYKINDGDADWTAKNTGLYSTVIKDMAVGASDMLYTADKVGVDQYAGMPTKTWSEVGASSEPYNIESLYFGVGGLIYAGTQDGVEWYNEHSHSPAWTKVGADIDEDTDTMAEHYGDLYSGTDEARVYEYSGRSAWSQVGADFSSKVVSLVNLVGHTQEGILYAAVYNDGVYKLDGSSWVAMNTGLPSSKQLVGLLDKGDTLYVADNSGVYAYDANSSTWVKVTNSPADVIGIGKDHDGLYALTDTDGSESVYRYSDSKAVWFKMNDGLPADLYGKDIMGGTGALYVDSNGLGVYQSSLT